MQDVKDLIKGVQENVPLAQYTTFKIGGLARYFCVAKNVDEIRKALEFAGKNKLKIFVLGGGSNLLVSDEGFNGLILRITNYELRITNNKIFVETGLFLAKLVNESTKDNLTGLEWLAGIPGTVGGAICNNAGAFGKCMADVVESVEVLEIRKLGNSIPPLKKGARGISGTRITNYELRITKLDNKQCRFSYRNSIFKKEKNYIILSAILKLEKGDKKEIKKIIAENLKLRNEKQPLKYPSAGSVFKNPSVDEKNFKKLIERRNPIPFKGIGFLNAAKEYIIPAAWLIEKCGLKGKRIGGAMVSDKHANFIVNFDNAKARDVVMLISLIKQKIRDNFGIYLEEEVIYVGF